MVRLGVKSLQIVGCGLVLAGCIPADTADDDDSAGNGPGQSFSVVATTDFTVGALATVDLDTWAVTDNITAATGDTVLVADDGLLLVINRYQHDSIRIYDPLELRVPLLEFSTGSGSNPTDARFCGGNLFVSLYEEDYLGVFDPDSGLQVGQVDLSAFIDDDGIPEASTMVRKGDQLYVGLERLDRSDAFWLASQGGGRVVTVDCPTREVVASVATGSNLQLYPHPMDDSALIVVEGVYWNSDGQVDLDGGIRMLDLDSGQLGPFVLTEEQAGGNLTGLALDGQGRGLVLIADDEGTGIHCIDMDSWVPEMVASTSLYIREIRANDRGEAHVLTRSWIDPEVAGGIRVFDLETCEDLTGDDWIRFELEPFSVAFF